MLGEQVKGAYSREYCGGGSPPQCRAALRRSLAAALKMPASEVYGGDKVCEDAGKPADQWCFDAVQQSPTGGAKQPLIHWINRPTCQQVVEIPRKLPR